MWIGLGSCRTLDKNVMWAVAFLFVQDTKLAGQRKGTFITTDVTHEAQCNLSIHPLVTVRFPGRWMQVRLKKQRTTSQKAGKDLARTGKTYQGYKLPRETNAKQLRKEKTSASGRLQGKYNKGEHKHRKSPGQRKKTFINMREDALWWSGVEIVHSDDTCLVRVV